MGCSEKGISKDGVKGDTERILDIERDGKGEIDRAKESKRE